MKSCCLLQPLVFIKSPANSRAASLLVTNPLLVCDWNYLHSFFPCRRRCLLFHLQPQQTSGTECIQDDILESFPSLLTRQDGCQRRIHRARFSCFQLPDNNDSYGVAPKITPTSHKISYYLTWPLSLNQLYTACIRTQTDFMFFWGQTFCPAVFQITQCSTPIWLIAWFRILKSQIKSIQTPELRPTYLKTDWLPVRSYLAGGSGFLACFGSLLSANKNKKQN